MENKWVSLNTNLIIEKADKAMEICDNNTDCNNCKANQYCTNICEYRSKLKSELESISNTPYKILYRDYIPSSNYKTTADFAGIVTTIDMIDYYLANSCNGDCELCDYAQFCKSIDKTAEEIYSQFQLFLENSKQRYFY